MKKKMLVTLFFISLVVLSPIKINALSINCSETNFLSSIYLLEKDTTSSDLEEWMDDYNQEQNCEGANSILGDPKDENSVAWLLQQILNYIKIVGPILVIVLSSIDFLQVIIKSDDDAMKKAQKTLFMRLLLAASLFFVPLFVQVLLDIFGITANPTCGIN